MKMQTNRSNPGALLGGTLLIAIGLLSLAMRFLRVVDWAFLWPSIMTGFGALFFVAMFAGGKEFAALAIPGSFISGMGLMLLFQNITGHWELMSYFWTLIILFLGVGIYTMGLYAGDEKQKQAGTSVMKAGLVLFLIFGTFFEMIFSSFNHTLFPLLLIGLGVYIVLKRAGRFGGENKHPSDSLPPVR
jgi:hypothetical protein